MKHKDYFRMKIINNFYKEYRWFLGNSNNFGPIQIAFIKKEKTKAHHYHVKAFEYFIILRGDATLEVNGKDILLNKGCIATIEPGEKHALKEMSEDLEMLLLMDNYYENDTIITE